MKQTNIQIRLMVLALTITFSQCFTGNPVKAQTGKGQRYKIAVVDLMILKRQKIGAPGLTRQIGADGLEVDMGGLGTRETFDNHLANEAFRKQYQDSAKKYHVQFCSMAMTGFFAQSFATRTGVDRMVQDCINTMKQMGIKVAFLPLGVQCDLKKNPNLRPTIVERLKTIGALAQKAGVVIGIETSLDAAGEIKLLQEVGSPAIKIYFNFSNPLKEGRNLYKELEILGKEHICQIHCTNKDSVWLQNDPQIDMKKVKKTLDRIGYHGWLVIERSRDASQPGNVKGNFGANTAYLKKIFQ